jgi:general secretion pathway protein A
VSTGDLVENHFGLRQPAFQLTPDPAFYFGSAHHAQVLADMRFGLHKAEGFMVVTGTAGLGKTMLVKSLLQGLQEQNIEAAHLVVLPEGEHQLLAHVLSAFGVPVRGGSPAQLLAAMEAYLLTLATQQKRALLVVDEAQGLDRDALEQLRTLTNLHVGTHSLLQVFLVGQPELARMLNSSSMTQLRQRVLALCKLEPLDAAQTQAYIEHRLRHAGWQGNPSIDAQAFDAIHRWSEGVPRRINALCDRLLWATFIEGSSSVTQALVIRAAKEVDAELRDALPATASASDDHWKLPGAAAWSAAESPLMCIAADHLEVLLGRALNQQLRTIDTAPNMVMVAPDVKAVARIAARGEPAPAYMEMPLGLDAAGFPRDMIETLRRVDALLEVMRPCGMIVLGDSDMALASALVAQRRGIPLARAQAGLRSGHPSGNAALIERLTQLNLVPHARALEHLQVEGLPAELAQVVGSLSLSLVAQASAQGWGLPEAWHRSGAGEAGLNLRLPYAVASLRVWPDDPWPADTADVLRAIASQIQVLWLVDGESRAAMGQGGFAQAMRRHGVRTLHTTDNLDTVLLLAHARFLLHDTSLQLTSLAESMGLPLMHFDAQDQARHLPTNAADAVIEDSDEAFKALKHILLQAESRPRSQDVQAAGQAAALLHAWVSLSHAPQP